MNYLHNDTWHPYERYVYERFLTALSELPSEIREDVYALSFLYGIFWKGEVVCTDYMELSYNTESHYRSQIPEASDAEEARWNFAFWKQDCLAQVPDFGDTDDDPNEDELGMRDRYLTSLGLHPTGRDDSGRPTYFGLDTENAIARLGAKVAERLHREGAIQCLFARPIPVVIHNLTYNDAGRRATRQGNPPEVLAGAALWTFSEDGAE